VTKNTKTCSGPSSPRGADTPGRNNHTPPDTDFPRQLYTPAEAAEWLSVKEDTVRGLHRAQKLTGVKVGKHLRFRRGDLQRYVEELEAG
jgi:excisionase family DNA binding protein